MENGQNNLQELESGMQNIDDLGDYQELVSDVSIERNDTRTLCPTFKKMIRPLCIFIICVLMMVFYNFIRSTEATNTLDDKR